MSDILRELARPFPERYVHSNPSGGGSYIKHHVIEQRLIQVFGRPPNFERVEVVFGDVDAIPPNPNGKSQRAKEGRPALKGVIVGVIARLSVNVNDETWTAEEVGDCEEPHNWKTDGQRLKDAMSDAYKRCAMRWGCGLHLWSQDEYFLHDVLNKEVGGSSNRKVEEPASSPVAQPPTTSKAQSSPEEPKAASKEPRAEKPQAASTPSSPEGVEATGTLGEDRSETSGPNESGSEASSGDTYGAIATAMADKKLAMKVLIHATKIAQAKNLIPEKGISKENVMELPEDLLELVADELNLHEKASA